MDRPVWVPSPQRVERSAMTRFIHHVRRGGAAGVTDYDSLYRWSITEPARFWSAVWEFCGVLADTRGEVVVEGIDRMPGARWFPRARLNFAENLLAREGDRPALVARDETGARRTLSRAELAGAVRRVAAWLSERGIGPGDRVAGLLPNVPETVIAMLASATLGATWSSCSPDFGTAAILDRFGQIRPSVLVAAAGCRYGGRRIDLGERVRAVAGKIPSIRAIVTVGGEPLRDERESVSFETILQRPDAAVPFASQPFDHPLYILYSSGTTGSPKCIVHGAGGTLLQHLKEQVLHTDMGPGDVVFYYTTCGWMMWNWLVSALATGATVVLYDGSPVHPDPAALWRMAAEEKVTVFGTSAGYLSAIEKQGVRPGRDHDLSSLRTILSTGSPLAPRSYDYVYREIDDDLQLSSISGGTDIISCFALGNPLGPVYRGELQCRGLGMKVEILDDTGRPLPAGKGELCCTMPFPSMPVGFWDDPSSERYRRAYFDRFDGVWCHGDYAELTPHGGLIIHGRSDATLNPGGVRIGTAEIYRVVEKMPEIAESVAVGQRWNDDTRIVLFVVMRPGYALDDALHARIRAKLRQEASPRHVPAVILPVQEIPKTISGKIVELAIQSVVNGEPVANRDAIVRPEALDQFRDLPALGGSDPPRDA